MKVKLPYSPREFDPTPEDLVGHYLKNHILRLPYNESGTIQEETMYGEDINPWDKFCNPHNPYPWQGESTSTQTLFLFTKLSDVGSTDKSSSIQKHRRSGCGTWHGTSSVKKVTSSIDEQVIGHYRILSFRSSNGEETIGQWTMYEYGISAKAFPEILRVEGWQNQVVCRIKRDDGKANIGGKLSRNKSKSLSKSVPNKKRQAASIIEEGEEEEEKKVIMDNVGVAEFVNHAIQEHDPDKMMRATSIIKDEEEKKVVMDNVGVAEFVNHVIQELVPNKMMRATSVIKKEEKKVVMDNIGVAEFVNRAIQEHVPNKMMREEEEEKKVVMDNVGVARFVNRVIQEPIPNKMMRATSIIKENGEKKVVMDNVGVAGFVNRAFQEPVPNKMMRANSIFKEDDEKKVVVDNVGVAEFVNHQIQEPDQANYSHYWELAESCMSIDMDEYVDMDDFFNSIECN